MKALQFTWLLLISFGFFNFAFSQTKPVALKFDEYEVTVNSSEQETESVRLESFALQLKKQPQMRAVIIGYDPKKQSYDEHWIGDNAILIVQRKLEQNGIAEKRIIRLFGGIREKKSYELWLLPKDAELPQPHPEFEKSDIVYCPAWVRAEGIDYSFDRSKSLEINAKVEKVIPSQNLVYEWETSTGKITSGQGTAKIKIDVDGTKENNLIIKLNVKGLSLECKNQDTKTITFVNYPYKIAEFPDYGENLKWYPDVFFTELHNKPELQGKIYVYGARNIGKRSVISGISKLNRMFAFRQFPSELLARAAIEIGGYRDDLTFEMWLYPKGAESPKPTPTVDEKFIVFTNKTKKQTDKRK